MRISEPFARACSRCSSSARFSGESDSMVAARGCALAGAGRSADRIPLHVRRVQPAHELLARRRATRADSRSYAARSASSSSSAATHGARSFGCTTGFGMACSSNTGW